LIWADYNVRITDDLLVYVKLMPILEFVGKICGILGVVLGLLMVFWYPHQMIWQKSPMHKIEISSIETNRSLEPVKNNDVEDSPLLKGLQYAAAKDGAGNGN